MTDGEIGDELGCIEGRFQPNKQLATNGFVIFLVIRQAFFSQYFLHSPENSTGGND